MLNNDMSLIAERMIEHFINNDAVARVGRSARAGAGGKITDAAGDAEAVAAASMALLSADGSFTDIDYSNDSMSSWSPSAHLARLREMTVAYKRGSGETMLASVEKGLRYWFSRKPVSKNWWHNQIGQQIQLGPIALMLRNELPKELICACADALLDPTKVGPGFITGQNLVWFATESIYRGLLKEDECDFTSGIDYILKEITISKREGIQPDYSFHQHGPQLYNGGYGLGFIRDTSYFAYMLRDTAYAFPPDKLELIAGLLLEGDRWMVYGHWMDYCVQGREIARVGGDAKALSLLPVCDMLAELTPAHATKIHALKSMINGDARSCVTGNKHFYRSDYMSHRAAGFGSSVRMASSRMHGTEMMNRENRFGCWLPFGVHHTLVNGDEYEGIVPLLDWTRLSGVTAPKMLYTMPVYVKTDVEFVGGASDGVCGVSAMMLDKLDVRAHKAWFFFGDEIVCLGADIDSRSDFNVLTTLNQCRSRGDIYADGVKLETGSAKLPRAGRIYHDHIAYLPEDGTEVCVESEQRVGSWSDIGVAEGAPVEGDVFTIYIDHGLRQTGARYAYTIMPDVTPEDYLLRERRCKILANTGKLQAVYYAPGGASGGGGSGGGDGANAITGSAGGAVAGSGHVTAPFYETGELGAPGYISAVFYASGELALEGITISVSAPCILLLKTNASGCELTTACPLAAVEFIDFALTASGKTIHKRIDLPREDETGASVKTLIDII